MKMGDNDAITGKTAKTDFGAASISRSKAVLALVKHLARIHAEEDYKAFIKSQNRAYDGPSQKGPSP